jgi:hypothetical protein
MGISAMRFNISCCSTIKLFGIIACYSYSKFIKTSKGKTNDNECYLTLPWWNSQEVSLPVMRINIEYNDVVASGTQPVAYRYIIVFAVYSMCAPRH